jgi:hypothetical protein
MMRPHHTVDLEAQAHVDAQGAGAGTGAGTGTGTGTGTGAGTGAGIGTGAGTGAGTGIGLALGLVLGLAGCGDGQVGCRSDLDCPGGACVVGQCRPLVGADLASSDGGAADLAGFDLAGADLARPANDLAGDAAPLCSFNGDGVIEASEEPFIVGLGALFAVNAAGTAVPVDLTPKNGAWDFSAPVQGERKVFDQLLPAGGQWWSADFPTATHAEKLDDGQSLYGVYRATGSALQLLGIVSDTGGLQQTELTYATPIDVLRFPLMQGSSWSQTSNVTGQAQGIFVAANDSYSFTVDARGTTTVPAGSFDALRLRIDYSETVGLLTTTRFTYLHLAECYGAVARIRSQDDEPSADFTQAAEYRRLATQ